MTENLQLGLQLLMIGMISVFFILSIVVGIGKGIITFTNSIGPSSTASSPNLERTKTGISNKQIAVISAVVDIVTNNKGQIKSINKYDPNQKL